LSTWNPRWPRRSRRNRGSTWHVQFPRPGANPQADGGVTEYGDDPPVEPGDVAVRVFLPWPDGPGDEEADEDIVGVFEKANRERLRKLHDELPRLIAWVEFQADHPDEAEKPAVTS
jgi:hypothetical protein